MHPKWKVQSLHLFILFLLGLPSLTVDVCLFSLYSTCCKDISFNTKEEKKPTNHTWIHIVFEAIEQSFALRGLLVTRREMKVFTSLRSVKILQYAEGVIHWSPDVCNISPMIINYVNLCHLRWREDDGKEILDECMRGREARCAVHTQ